ncbi:3-isopropylmalate dehydratase small subunit [Rhodococcus sp. SRB_17]|uniref:3-isopropylmalate dehydratase small subunit n=1 Tax=Acidovorax sp. SRB_24 TaxID=1962700 RepID=UPI001982407F|nr:3-isopropylmalate dehydratase small subunit [Acidovorax sp. SRB_24]NMM76917.1 3-isopropylmalate dehydratase small subunit [Acidovorax sp. SRB_24]NMM87367.1 3-isopropylmalate dehydratase small subunit [Rhodococcus sp. SRB_17]
MERFVKLRGIALPMMLVNIDTDQITPGKELVRAKLDGKYARALFSNQRYLADGSPDPDFILNREPWNQATFLLADRNFGCGSSRESAPKALRDWGFRAIIAPSFGGIFYNSSFRNGLLPVELPIEQVKEIARQMRAADGREQITVDLESQTVTAPDGRRYSFNTPSVLRTMLLEGQDEIAITLARRVEIDAFRTKDRALRPWAYGISSRSA